MWFFNNCIGTTARILNVYRDSPGILSNKLDHQDPNVFGEHDFTTQQLKLQMGVEPRIGVAYPPNHPFVHRVFHYFHHPFWGFSPYFWFNTQIAFVQIAKWFGNLAFFDFKDGKLLMKLVMSYMWAMKKPYYMGIVSKTIIRIPINQLINQYTGK